MIDNSVKDGSGPPEVPKPNGPHKTRQYSTLLGAVLVAAALVSLAAPTSAAPPWERELGPGVSVSLPTHVVPGHGSPASAFIGFYKAMSDGNLESICGYVYPHSVITPCRTGLKGKNSLGVSVKNVGTGYVAVKGNEALVAMLGTYCQTGIGCFTDTNPAGIFPKRHSFEQLWSLYVAADTSVIDSLMPLVSVGTKWFVYASNR